MIFFIMKLYVVVIQLLYEHCSMNTFLKKNNSGVLELKKIKGLTLTLT